MIAIIILLALMMIIFIVTKSFLSKDKQISLDIKKISFIISLMTFFIGVGLRFYEFHINLNNNINFYQISEFFLYGSVIFFIIWIIAKLR